MLQPAEQEMAQEVLLQKYARGGERTADEVRRRVARALATAERERSRWEAPFLEAQRAGFIPAGRINASAGTSAQSTLINCFVQPVGDSVSSRTDGAPGIYAAMQEAAETMRRGGGVGYDFSPLRPSGALVGTTGALASGPLSYMRIFDRSCMTIQSAEGRRGAQMAVLRVDHPDIEEFVRAKREPGELTTFNLSVAVTDAFMRALSADAPFDLVHAAAPGPQRLAAGAFQRPDGQWVYATIDARVLWEAIVREAYDHAEPGILFIDRINAENNLCYLERIAATNPCGEEPLPPYGSCCLGSLNLTRFVRNPFTAQASFDAEGLRRVVPTAVRMLDDVLDVTYWPLAEQRREAMLKRRVGLGFTGLGDALIMLGLRYDTLEARQQAAEIARELRDEAYRASIDLAREKGAFPGLDAERYLSCRFTGRLPEDVREGIRRYGIRNSHVLSIAPTGTISLAFADNASTGIEPAYAWQYTRARRSLDGELRSAAVEDYAWRAYRAAGHEMRHLPPAFVTALDISARDHLAMVAAVAPYVDAAVSKTVNVPEDYPFADFHDLYMLAWRWGVKGVATYRPNPVTGAVLTVQAEEGPRLCRAPEACALEDGGA